MYITNTLKRGIVAGALAFMVLTTAVPAPQAQAATLEELQAQIATLLAQITQLQSQVGQGGTSVASGICPYAWTRSLSQGATGNDVMKLQQFLNADTDTRVSATGAGSVGAETMYYGPATAAAVSKFQVKYRAEILSPGGLVNPTGYFGPASLAKANALCVKTPTTPTTPATPTTPDVDDTPELSGEGELRTFEIDNASDTDIEEAASDAVVAELTMEAEHGDIEINRLDVRLVADGSNTEKDPWDTFETISLWVDGEEIASKDIDNRNDYLNRNSGIVRFTNLDLVLFEDEETEVMIAVSVQNGIKGAGTNASWNVSVERLRYFDADGVANDDTSTGDMGDVVSFDIVARGEGEELKFSLGSGNPNATDIIVETNRRTNNVTILEYEIEALDADIELDQLFVNVQTGTASYDDVVSDIRLQIGNQTFRKDEVLTTGSYSATSTRVSFDIDGDITIDEDEKEQVRVVVDLKSRTAYSNGETIRAQVTSEERNLTEAEGSDDVTDFSGTAIGKWHTLVSEGIVVSSDNVKFTTDSQGQNDTTGIFSIEFEVTAIEGSYYITEFASTSAGTTTGGVQFSVDTTAGAPTSISAVLSSSAKEDTSGVFTVREGETETFTLRVVVDAATAGQHRVLLENVWFSENSDGVASSEAYSTTPASSFRTPYQFINN